MVEIRLKGLTKSFGGSTKAVDNIDLTIEHGDFFTLVGPSGCGKTTTLRMIAGLETSTDGDIYFDDEKVTDLTTQQRDIAMVFQSIALFPHMNCHDNIAYGLRKRNETEDLDRRVRETAELLDVSDQLDKKPDQLSGGQQQRVALGRAIIRSPNVILLDEPMSDLDAKLKSELRVAVQELHKEIDTTMVYVTHDQEEAMTMSTRIGLMRDGHLEQVDHPEQLYDSPISEFSATFIGQPEMNLIEAELRNETTLAIQNDGSERHITFDTPIPESYGGQTVKLGFRPQHTTLTTDHDKGVLQFKFDLSEPNGDTYNVYLETEVGDRITVTTENDPDVSSGDLIGLKQFAKIYLFDPDTGKKIHQLAKDEFSLAPLAQ